MSDDKRTQVLVTGCSRGGIGDALAREFHRKGCRVFTTARNLSKIEHLKDMGMDVVSLDVESSESIASAARTVSELTGGRLDILVNNSGSGYNATLLDTDMDSAKKMFDVNVFGLLQTTQAFAPLLIASKGQIVNIGSIAGIMQVPFQGMYNASKAAVHCLSENLRLEMAPFGVKVIFVITGGIKTNFFDNVKEYFFPTDSLYDPARNVMEPILRGGQAKKMLGTDPDSYARTVVGNSLSWWPRARIWVGSQTLKSWLTTTFLWYGVADPIISRMFDLHKVKHKLKQAGKD